MHGNVSEWLSDWYIFNNTTYSIDPEGPLTGTYRVIRGGSFIYNDENLRSARRGFPFISSEGNIYFVGFRVGFQQVPDTESPELELFGGTDLLHELGKPWAEPGYAASDEQDGNLTGSVTISGTLDVNTFGTYTQSYTVADTAGNEANITRTVRVIDSNNDSDGDGFDDYIEAVAGSGSNDSNSTPFNFGLIAWYPFDGNASDKSGNGNHGTVNGATLGTDRHGNLSRAYIFDGVDDFIGLPQDKLLDGAEDATISVWFKFGDGFVYGQLLGAGDARGD